MHRVLRVRSQKTRTPGSHAGPRSQKTRTSGSHAAPLRPSDLPAAPALALGAGESARTFHLHHLSISRDAPEAQVAESHPPGHLSTPHTRATRHPGVMKIQLCPIYDIGVKCGGGGGRWGAPAWGEGRGMKGETYVSARDKSFKTKSVMKTFGPWTTSQWLSATSSGRGPRPNTAALILSRNAYSTSLEMM